jgi:hypothetical protein
LLNENELLKNQNNDTLSNKTNNLKNKSNEKQIEINNLNNKVKKLEDIIHSLKNRTEIEMKHQFVQVDNEEKNGKIICSKKICKDNSTNTSSSNQNENENENEILRYFTEFKNFESFKQFFSKYEKLKKQVLKLKSREYYFVKEKSKLSFQNSKLIDKNQELKYKTYNYEKNEKVFRNFLHHFCSDLKNCSNSFYINMSNFTKRINDFLSQKNNYNLGISTLNENSVMNQSLNITNDSSSFLENFEKEKNEIQSQMNEIVRENEKMNQKIEQLNKSLDKNNVFHQ